MKNYQFKDKQIRTRSKQKTKITIWLVSVFLVFGILSMIWPNLLTGFTHTIGKPLWKFKTNVAEKSILASITSYFKTKSTLNNKNLELKDILKESNYRLLEMELVKDENKRLRESLGMTNYFEKSVLSYVLSKPNKTPYDSLILDSGISEGVRVGDIVRFGESVVIGEIVGVEEKTSKARLFSTPGIQSEVVIGGSLATTAVGYGGGNFLIELPRDIIVKEGMSVHLSNFPRTLLGFIEAIEKNSQDSFQKVFIGSPVNINDIDLVFIIRVEK